MNLFLERQDVCKRRNWSIFLRRVERVSLSVLVVLAALAALYGLYVLIFLGSYFSINDIVLKGHWKRLDAPQLVEVAGVKQGDNLFLLNVREVHDRLMMHPWVREAAVRRHLPHTLLIAVGTAWLPLLAEIGLLLWLIPLARLAHSLLLLHRKKIWHWHGAATPLATAVIGLLLCLVAGALHGHGLLPASQANQAFVMAFLLPLVTGAATHLLPLWLWQKEPQEKQQALRDRIGRLSGIRSIAFLLAGMLALMAQPWALLLSIAALLHFLFQLASGVLLSRNH